MDFLKEVDNIFSKIIDAVDSVLGNDVDIDLVDDVLIIDASCGVFVISKRLTIQQIWLSSPLSGPYRFTLKSGLWQSKGGVNLINVLNQELCLNV